MPKLKASWPKNLEIENQYELDQLIAALGIYRKNSQRKAEELKDEDGYSSPRVLQFRTKSNSCRRLKDRAKELSDR